MTNISLIYHQGDLCSVDQLMGSFFIYNIHNNYIINNKSDKIEILKI
jgi:hypothetical protein